jgi:hypothetical protein
MQVFTHTTDYGVEADYLVGRGVERAVEGGLFKFLHILKGRCIDGIDGFEHGVQSGGWWLRRGDRRVGGIYTRSLGAWRGDLKIRWAGHDTSERILQRSPL